MAFLTGFPLRIVVACLALSLAGGCASFSTGSNKGQRSGSDATYNNSKTTGAYVVQNGDTVYALSRRFDVSVRTLIDVNRLSPPYTLYAGQKLTLPAAQNGYVVEKGDTLWSVSRKTGVPFATLVSMNNLSEPYSLKSGQRLNVSGARNGSTSPSGSSGEGGGNVTVIRSAQLGAGSQGDAPTTVASNAPVSTSGASGGADSSSTSTSTSSARGASQPADSYRPLTHRSDEPIAGQKEAPAAVAAAAQASQDNPQNPTPTTSSAPASATPAAASGAAAAQAAPPKPLPDPPKAAGGSYLWPAKGPVIATFGVTGKGQHNDGINIQIPKGTPIFAAENGVVAYAGNEIRGFGNLLLIKHASGWMTAYAHNDQLLVERGAIVKKGQKIALSGDSGGANPPQLHFEVRKGSRAVDPMSVLGSRTGSTASAGRAPGPS